MRSLILFACLLLLLAACDAAPPDPYTMAGQAAGAIRATQEAERLAREQQIYQAQQATLAAAALADKAQAEIDLLNAQLGATQTALAIDYERAEATRAAQQATQTADAYVLQSTAQAQEAQATSTALAGVMQAEADQARRRQMMDDLRSIVIPIAQMVIFLLVLAGAWRAFTWWIEWQDRKRSMYETRQGTVVWVLDGDGTPQPRLLAATTTTSGYTARRPDGYSQLPAVTLSPGAVTASSPARPALPENTTAALVLRLARDAERVEGGDSPIIPGWRRLPGWNSDQWQRAVAALREQQIVQTQAGEKTLLVGYECIADLVSALEQHKVRIRPAPYPTGGGVS